MKFIKKFENFTEMESHEMEEMCPECQCKMTGCECGSPMGYEEMEEEEMDANMDSEMPLYFEEEEEVDTYPMAYAEDEEEEMVPPSKMGHIMSFQEAKKAKPDFIDLDKDGDKKESMKKAAVDKKKKEEKSDKKEPKKAGKLTKAQEKLPEGLKKAIKAGVRD